MLFWLKGGGLVETDERETCFGGLGVGTSWVTLAVFVHHNSKTLRVDNDISNYGRGRWVEKTFQGIRVQYV